MLPFRGIGIPDVAYELLIVGDDVAELTVDMGIPVGIDKRGVPGVRGCKDGWASRKNDMEGETARRLEDEGYGSKRSSTVIDIRKTQQQSKGKTIHIFVYLTAQRWSLEVVYIAIAERACSTRMEMLRAIWIRVNHGIQ